MGLACALTNLDPAQCYINAAFVSTMWALLPRCQYHVGWWIGMQKHCLPWVAFQGDSGPNEFESYFLSFPSFLILVPSFWSTRPSRVLSTPLRLAGLPCAQHVLGNQIPAQCSFSSGRVTWKRWQKSKNQSCDLIVFTTNSCPFLLVTLLASVTVLPACWQVFVWNPRSHGPHGDIFEHAASKQSPYHSWSGLHFACFLRGSTAHVCGDIFCDGHGCISGDLMNGFYCAMNKVLDPNKFSGHYRKHHDNNKAPN